MPDRAVMELWVTALESGEYPQTRGTLHRREPITGIAGNTYPPGFCCLGVLCDLAEKAGIVTSSRYDDCGDIVTWYEADCGSAGHLPESVAEWAGLDSTNPEVTWFDGYRGHKETFVHLNDAEKMSFPEIAQIIRENYLEEPA